MLFGLLLVLFIAMVWVLTMKDVDEGGYTGAVSLDGNADSSPVKLSQYLPGIFFIGAVILAMVYFERA